jgi:hypothetical protein
LKIAEQAEVNTAASRGRKRARTAAVDVELGAGEDEVLEVVRSDSEPDYIIVAGSRTF